VVRQKWRIISDERKQSKQEMRAQDFIHKCIDLKQSFTLWQRSDYIDYMQEQFNLIEGDKPKSADDVIRRLKAHFDKGYFDSVDNEAPLFLCD
jgi:hypothetical protein